MNQVHKPLR